MAEISPRQPATKRTKDDSFETDGYGTLNELGWVIQTPSIDKRKTAKSGVQPLDECLSELQSIYKELKKSNNKFTAKNVFFTELTTEFVNCYTKKLMEKDDVILTLKIENEKLKTSIAESKNISTSSPPATQSFANIVTRYRPKTSTRNRSKSRQSKNRTRSKLAMIITPPQAFHLLSNEDDPATTKASLWKSVTKKLRAPKINLITTKAGKIIVKP